MNFFKIPHSKARDVAEYFALPKNEREHYGLYKLPYALPSEYFDENIKGWGAFYKEIKKQYPFQWFVRYWLGSYNNPIYKFGCYWIKWPLRNFYWNARRFIHPSFPKWRKTLPRHKYADVSFLLTESNFNLLLDFYEQEANCNYINWESDELHRKFYNKLTKYAKWINEGRIALQRKLDEELDVATNNRTEKNYHKKYGKYNDLETKMRHKETEILNWIIENREMFWT